jgi:hypothetical protein
MAAAPARAAAVPSSIFFMPCSVYDHISQRGSKKIAIAGGSYKERFQK